MNEIKRIKFEHHEARALREKIAREIEQTCPILRRKPNTFCTCAAHRYAKIARGQ